MVNYIGKNMNKNELVDNIIDAAWIIKTKYPKYKPQKNISLPVTTIMNFVVHAEGDVEINGMIYYSYWLVLGCLYE